MKQLVFDVWGKILPLVVIIGLTLVVGCSTSTDPDPEPVPREPEPVERVGERELTITVIDREDETGLTGYNIEISGPVTASAENVSTSEYVLENLESGEYTIEITLDGYVEASVTETYAVPEDESADYLAGETISLRELTPPVKINNSEATTVQTGKPDSEDATEEEAVTLAIPANTFPAEVVNEDGSVDISVTRARPSKATAGESGGQVSESLILQPTAVLNDTVTVTIPVRDVQGSEGIEYVLQPGNIPLSSDANGNLTAKLAPGASQLPITFADIFEFIIYQIVASNVEVEVEDGFTDYRSVGNGQCGVAVNTTYTTADVSVPGIIELYSSDSRIKRFGISKQIQVDAVPDNILLVEARNKTRTYTLLVDGNERASVTVDLAVVETEVEQIVCHDSGGSGN